MATSGWSVRMTLAIAALMWIVSVCDGKQKNVLFIVADDLRPEIPAYYTDTSQFYENIVTPELNKLVKKSIVFEKAYVQMAICAPSRTSYMTSRRIETTKVDNLVDYWRNVGGNFTTIPQYFKEKGYRTKGIGKIYHEGASAGNDDDGYSWTETYFHGSPNHQSEDKSYATVTERRLNNGGRLIDEQIADEAIQALEDLKNDYFFLAVGFRKPHLPFVCPATTMAAHYPDFTAIGLPSNPYVPTDMPTRAWKDWEELRVYKDVNDTGVTGAINETLSNAFTRQLRRHYYCCVTFMDEQLGRVIDAVTAKGLENDTIISFIGDHGFLLGEHGGWCKASQFELATHTPMMMHIPSKTDSGITTSQLVEFVDLFPTLVEAAELPNGERIETCKEDLTNSITCTEGMSMMPLIDEPDVAIKNAAFSQQKRGRYMGFTIRAADLRYTEYVLFDSTDRTANWDNVQDSNKELYDLTLDPNENTNQVFNSAYADEMALLADALRAGWRSVIVTK